MYIGFLVNYDLCNIYYIWLFSFKHIIYIRDVIFIKNEFYKLNKLDLGFIKDVEKIMKYFEILLSRSVFEQEESDSDKEELSYIYD